MRYNPISEKRTKELLKLVSSRKFLENLDPRSIVVGYGARGVPLRRRGGDIVFFHKLDPSLSPKRDLKEVFKIAGGKHYHQTVLGAGGIGAYMDLILEDFNNAVSISTRTPFPAKEYYETRVARAKDLKSFIDAMAGMDPTRTGKYTPWIAKIWGRGEITLEEDEEVVTDLLKKFERHKRRLEKRDINSYASYSELSKALREADPSRRRAIKRKRMAGKRLIHDDGTVQSYYITSLEAAQDTFKDTLWCVRGKDQYIRYIEGPEKDDPGPGFLIYYSLKDKPYALYYRSEGGYVEIRDIDNEPISRKMWETLIEHVKEYTLDALCPHGTLPRIECEDCSTMVCSEGSLQCSEEECEDEFYCENCSGLDTCSGCRELKCVSHIDVCPCGSGAYCESCMMECSACNSKYCPECFYECESCGETVCRDCATSCSECGESICITCEIGCAAYSCGESLCADCRKSCVDCGEARCSSHIEECDGCEDEVCDDCSVSCHVKDCNKTALCWSCHNTCPECYDPTCQEHLKEDAAIPLFGYEGGPDLCVECFEEKSKQP